MGAYFPKEADSVAKMVGEAKEYWICAATSMGMGKKEAKQLIEATYLRALRDSLRHNIKGYVGKVVHDAIANLLEVKKVDSPTSSR